MNEIEKFLRKLSPNDQSKVLEYINQLITDPTAFGGKKLTGSDYYRARKGRYRFIYHYTGKKHVKIDVVRLRDEKTYRDF
ncbi:type II toxin-antitoxin system RelE/ParE family toxin [Candidatus Pacebacteria bacterium]|nr:type II toxin-antitoxin system RelE/ParE family toxin [Candidatus Paceibacterota bacterium]